MVKNMFDKFLKIFIFKLKKWGTKTKHASIMMKELKRRIG